MPVTERRLVLAGIGTTVLEGGEGPPLVLLHGPGEHAAKWLRVIPGLVKTCRVIAPDLPGHGTSEVVDGAIDADRVLTWLGDLITQTCEAPPVLVGQIIGGAIAARFAAVHGDRLRCLVLSDTLGLAPFQPAPEFGAALMAFVEEPSAENHDRLWQRCAFDLDALRNRMGEGWDRLRAYNLDRARVPSLKPTQQGLMEEFGFPAIPPEELGHISVPTVLIWGRHDLATPLPVAEAASARYGWLLYVVEGAADAVQSVRPDFDGPPMDPPPLPYQLSDSERLARELIEAELKDVGVETVIERTTFETGEDLWDWIVWSNPIVEEILGTLNLSESEGGGSSAGGCIAWSETGLETQPPPF